MSKQTLDRRFFLKAGAVTAAFFASGFHRLQGATTRAVTALQTRIDSIYAKDAAAPVRRPQDNEEVRALYNEYLGVPLGQLSEKLLHTTYTDRSAKIKSLEAGGIKLTLKTSITKL